MVKLFEVLTLLLSIIVPTLSSLPLRADQTQLGSQSIYFYRDTESASYAAPICDWNITIVDYLEITNEISDGKFLLSTNYSINDHHYDIELFEEDCLTTPSGPTNFPLEFYNAINDASNVTYNNDIELQFVYDQAKIQESSLWTGYPDGRGEAKFCIRFNNYLSKPGDVNYYGPSGSDDPFYLQINFLEITYNIVVDSLTDFQIDSNIDITRDGSEDGGTQFINYEENIIAYTCDTSFQNVSLEYAQGDFVNICVETVEGSAFEVHSIKDLTVLQMNETATPAVPILQFDYVSDFRDSPLSVSQCRHSNTTAAVCMTKMQLLSSWFGADTMSVSDSELYVTGSIRLDYLGRRLSVNVPLNVRVGGYADEQKRVDIRALTENPSAGFALKLLMTDGVESTGMSLRGFFSAAVAFIAGVYTAVV